MKKYNLLHGDQPDINETFINEDGVKLKCVRSTNCETPYGNCYYLSGTNCSYVTCTATLTKYSIDKAFVKVD